LRFCGNVAPEKHHVSEKKSRWYLQRPPCVLGRLLAWLALRGVVPLQVRSDLKFALFVFWAGGESDEDVNGGANKKWIGIVL
jgi:hypothetical protein